MYGSTFNLCGPLYTGSTIFIYGGPHRLIFLILKGDFSICVVQSPYLFRGGGGGSSSFNFLDTKKAICPCTFKNMISLSLEISNELDEIKGRIHELLCQGFV